MSNTMAFEQVWNDRGVSPQQTDQSWIVRSRPQQEAQATDSPTQEHVVYEQAYNFFNATLFDGQLPPCLLTFQRHANAYGYYSPERFTSRTKADETTDEIALNPDLFAACPDKEILGTLVHEMSHCWQAHCGAPGRRGYHNREWASKMVHLGLLPISLDNPGKMTGQKVTHMIIPDGPFDMAADELLACDFALTWQSIGYSRHETPKQRTVSKLKYTCPICAQNAWAKPKAQLICGRCIEPMVWVYRP